MSKPSENEFSLDDTFGEAMSKLLAHRWEHVGAMLATAIEGTDLEGVHDLRVASRRLQAAMDVSSELFPRSWFRPLNRTAKRITSELSPVRDLDLLTSFLSKEQERADPGATAGIERLLERLETERQVARSEMIDYLTDLEAEDLLVEVRKRFQLQHSMSARENQ